MSCEIYRLKKKKKLGHETLKEKEPTESPYTHHLKRKTTRR
jgi:hypothetical protein